MHQNLLSFLLSQFGLHLLDTEIDTDCITVSVSSAKSSAQCPKCHCISSKVHSGYIRTLADLPFGTRSYSAPENSPVFLSKT
jgi:hypothetical protein